MEGTRHTNEESRPFICIPGGPSAAKAVLSFFFFFFWARSFFLSLLLPSLLGSPLCYEVSVTRFAHIQFGPCRCRQQKQNQRQSLEGLQTHPQFLFFLLPFFFIFFAMRDNFIPFDRYAQKAGKKSNQRRRPRKMGAGCYWLTYLFRLADNGTRASGYLL